MELIREEKIRGIRHPEVFTVSGMLELVYSS